MLRGEVYPLVAISTQSSDFESNICRMRDKGDNSAARRHFSDKYCKWRQNTGLNFFDGSDQLSDLTLQRSIYKLTVFGLKKSNKTQQYADNYLLLNYSTCFGPPSHPSSGVHKTVVAASGTDHAIWGASFLKRDQIRTDLVTFEQACSPDSMICTWGWNCSFMYSWWWVRWRPRAWPNQSVFGQVWGCLLPR